MLVYKKLASFAIYDTEEKLKIIVILHCLTFLVLVILPCLCIVTD